MMVCRSEKRLGRRSEGVPGPWGRAKNRAYTPGDGKDGPAAFGILYSTSYYREH
jgi:hypothetical protein